MQQFIQNQQQSGFPIQAKNNMNPVVQGGTMPMDSGNTNNQMVNQQQNSQQQYAFLMQQQQQQQQQVEFPFILYILSKKAFENSTLSHPKIANCDFQNVCTVFLLIHQRTVSIFPMMVF